MSRRLSLALLAVMLLTSGTLCVLSMRLDSATDDEPAHIAAGYLRVAKGHFDFYAEQPPLIDSISALPLVAKGYMLAQGWDAPAVNPWRYGKRFLYDAGNDAHAMLFRARLPIVALFLLLTLLVHSWALDLTGSRAAALLAAGLAAFSPNLLAHGGLATVDIGATLFIALAAFTFLRFLRSPTTPRAIVAGVAFALAVMAKVSAMILVPWGCLVGVLFLAGERNRWSERAAPALPRTLLLIGVALVIFEVFYLVELRGATVGLFTRLEAPFTEYGKHISTIYRWVSDPYAQPQFLLGRFSSTGWWYYYLVAIAVKTPFTTLLLLALALGAIVARPRRWSFDVGAMLLFVVLFLGASCASRMNIGLRHVLPIYPFLYVLVAVVAHRLVQDAGRWRRGIAGAIALAACGTVATAFAAFPSFIGYFNLFVSARDADRVLIDSNLDWGQDLRRLAQWVDASGVSTIHVWYFGGGDPAYELGAKARLLDACTVTEPGYYAISRQYFRGHEDTCELAFRDARRVTTIGSSILVFEAGPHESPPAIPGPR
jgi:hypothetical protein